MGIRDIKDLNIFIYREPYLQNFFIAVVNLLPVPGLDGWRIYKTNIKNKKFINLLTILIIFAIIVNILPWFFIA